MIDPAISQTLERHYEAIPECFSCGAPLGPQSVMDEWFRGFCDEHCEADFHDAHSEVCR